MANEFNLDDLFGDLESETKLSSVLYFPKKGEDLVLFMLAPMEYEGKLTLSVAVESDYKGKPSTQHIMRFGIVKFDGKTPNWDKTEFVGIPLAKTIVAEIIKAFKGEFQLAQQTCNPLHLMKPQKTSLMALPKVITVPDEVWAKGSEYPTWEELVKAHENMQANVKAKNNTEDTEESTPW